jgi:hypothetical protein
LARINKPKPAAKVIYAQEILTAPGLRKVMFDIFVSRRPLILGAIINRLSASRLTVRAWPTERAVLARTVGMD